MTEEIPPQDLRRIPTGIAGFDTICDGGPLEGGLYLMIGRPGTGKTVFANHMCFEHVRRSRGPRTPKVVYVTLLAESHGRMMSHINPFGFFDPHVVGNELTYVGGYQTMEEKGLKGLLDLVRTMVRDTHASLLVIDGLVSAAAVAASEIQFKRFIHQLAAFAHGERCTTWILSSAPDRDQGEPEYTMVDGIVELLVQQVNVRTAREIVVRKLRGVHFLEGRHTLQIASEGIVIHPRVEALVARQGAVAPEIDTPQALGIPEIDRMLHGGVLTGSTTLLLGAPGTGKTSVALHFLCGAPDAQEPALFLGFYESPARLVGKAEKLGLPLKSRLASGTVELHWRLSVETRLDEIAATILADVDRRGVRRVVIDGLGGFGETAVYPERVLPFVTALLAALRARGVTTLATLETTAAVRGVVDPQLAVSPLVDNVIVLRTVEERDRLRRMIAIRKVREGDFDASTREFEIGPSGIAVAARARVAP